MAHYAQVIDGIVARVVVADQEFVDSFLKGSEPGDWIQTSYNTRGNVHTLGGQPLRGNFAGKGYTYDAANDVFYEPKPYPSWTLNHSTWLWNPPVPYPSDDNGPYKWNEESLNWVKL